MRNIKWNKLLRNPFRYYKIYKRKNKIRHIHYDRLFRESILGIWATRRKVEVPLLDMFIKHNGISLYESDDRFIYTCEIKHLDNN
jgi:hypothetical protein